MDRRNSWRVLSTGGAPSQGRDPFTAPYREARYKVDTAFHGSYSKERQTFQDGLIEEILRGRPNEWIDCAPSVARPHVPSAVRSPIVIFLAGAMGAGKTHVLTWASNHTGFDTQSYVKIDQDDIRDKLPEAEAYDANVMGERTQLESGYIAELAQHAAMSKSMDTIVDGSLRDWEWYGGHFATLREAYPSYKLVILYVACAEVTMLRRARERADRTGRVVPPELLVTAHREVPLSVEFLTNRVDLVAHVLNEAGGPKVTKLSSSLSRHDSMELPADGWPALVQTLRELATGGGGGSEGARDALASPALPHSR